MAVTEDNDKKRHDRWERCLYVTSIVFNCIIFITGAVILGIGIWVAVADGGFKALLNDAMFAGIYILIAGGGVILLTAILGIIGCIKKSKRCVWVYAAFLLAVVVLKIVGTILTFVFYDTASDSLRNSYKTRYGNDSDITGLWDNIQLQGGCCGLYKYSDWEDSTFYAAEKLYPTSCCIKDDPTSIESCVVGRAGYIYEDGCEWLIRRYYYAIGGTTIGVIFLELLTIIFMACLFQYFS